MSPRPHWAFIACAAALQAGMEDAATENHADAQRRAVSPRVAELLASAAPKFVPPPAGAAAIPSNPGNTDGGAAAAAATADKPLNGIVRLPDYVVREGKEKRLPGTEEVLVPRELEKLAMNELLGPESGLDRGILNLVTVPALWEKIPVLGRIPLGGPWETNEQRAMRLYREDRTRKMKAELESLLSPELQSSRTKQPK
jgi:hypothetical protein